MLWWRRSPSTGRPMSSAVRTAPSPLPTARDEQGRDDSRLDDPLGGILLLLLALLVFSCSDATAKYLSGDLPVVEIVWLRYVVFALLLVPSALRGGGVANQAAGAAFAARIGAAAVRIPVHRRLTLSAAGRRHLDRVRFAVVHHRLVDPVPGRAGRTAALGRDRGRLDRRADRGPAGDERVPAGLAAADPVGADLGRRDHHHAQDERDRGHDHDAPLLGRLGAGRGERRGAVRLGLAGSGRTRAGAGLWALRQRRAMAGRTRLSTSRRLGAGALLLQPAGLGGRAGVSGFRRNPGSLDCRRSRGDRRQRALYGASRTDPGARAVGGPTLRAVTNRPDSRIAVRAGRKNP